MPLPPAVRKPRRAPETPTIIREHLLPILASKVLSYLADGSMPEELQIVLDETGGFTTSSLDRTSPPPQPPILPPGRLVSQAIRTSVVFYVSAAGCCAPDQLGLTGGSQIVMAALGKESGGGGSGAAGLSFRGELLG